MGWLVAGALLLLLVLSALILVQRRATPADAQARHEILVNDDYIAVIDALGQRSAVAWDNLERVDIRTTDSGPMAADLFWGLHSTDDPGVLVFPGGAIGEGEFINAMRVRLAGFDHEELMHAMGSTSNALFTVWDRHAETPARTA
jgi:hypothetical protein